MLATWRPIPPVLALSTCAIFTIGTHPPGGRGRRAQSSSGQPRLGETQHPDEDHRADQRQPDRARRLPRAGRRRRVAEPATAQPRPPRRREQTGQHRPAQRAAQRDGRRTTDQDPADDGADAQTGRHRDGQQRHGPAERARHADDHRAPPGDGHHTGVPGPVLGQQGARGQPEQRETDHRGAEEHDRPASAAVRPEPGPSTNTRATGTAVATSSAAPNQAEIVTTGRNSASTPRTCTGIAVGRRGQPGKGHCSSGARARRTAAGRTRWPRCTGSARPDRDCAGRSS